MKAKPLHALAAAALPLSIACAPLQAHTPSLTPSDVATQAKARITLDAASSETFSIPDVAIDNARLGMAGPDGARTAPDTPQVLEARTVVERRLAAAGIDRLSTGLRLGAVFPHLAARRQDPQQPRCQRTAAGRRGAAQPFPVAGPAGTCVTAGAPDTGALTPHGEGRVIVPLPRPGDLSAGECFAFGVRFDGPLLPDRTVELIEAVWNPDRTPPETSPPIDAQGRARLSLEQAGTVLALVRHRRPVPEDSNRDTPRVRVREQ